MDINNDFYVILQCNSAQHTVTYEDPIILDHIRNWKVALTEFAYPHKRWTVEKDYAITVISTCFTHTNILMKSIKIDVTTRDLSTPIFVHDPLQPRDLNDGEYKFEMPKVYVNSDSKIVFVNTSRTDVVLSDTTSGEQAWNDTSKRWETTMNQLKVSDEQRKQGHIILNNVQMKCRSPNYFVKQREEIVRFALTMSIDKLIETLTPIFAKLNLIISKSNQCITIKSQQMHVQKNQYEDWRDIRYIEFHNNFHSILGLKNQSYSGLHDNFEFVAELPPQLHHPIPYFNVFTNITHPVRIDKNKTTLLRTISLDNQNVHEGNRSIVIANPMYIPVNTNIISEIQLFIKTPNGDDAPLENARITLHLKSFGYKHT